MARIFEDYIEYINRTIRIPKEQPYLAIDLFAGCGGLSLGFEAAGIKTIGYEMIEEYCNTYRKNLMSECYHQKITTETRYPRVDIIIGGPPCQPFSRRGKRKGEADDRNGFPAFIEAVKKLEPSIWICENVKGLPEQNKEYFESIIKQFEALGYIVEKDVFQLVKFDVPQNRERLVIVGHKGGFVFPNPNDYVITSGEALGTLVSEIPEHAAFLTPAMDEYIAKYEAASKCKVPRDLHLDKPARTLTCRNLAGATSDMQRIRLPDGRRRRLTVREAARLQSFPDWFQFFGTEESQFTQIGNAVPPMFAYHLAQSVVEYLQIEGRKNMNKQCLPTIAYKRRKLKAGYKKGFDEKSEAVQTLIREALHVVEELGIPTDSLTDIRKEKIAMALLAVGDIKSSKDWAKIKDANKSYSVTTKQMISFYNQYLEDETSMGSYDYVLRHGLKPLIISGIVVQSKPESNISDSTRGYKISVEYSRIIRKYKQKDWHQQVEIFNKSHKTYAERLAQKRDIPKIAVRTADGQVFELKDGEHNLIQRQVIQEFLPRFGYGAKILYCGDSDNKYGVINEKDTMKQIGMEDIKQGKLPDIVAYSEEKDWVYLIEAYHTSNPITPERKFELEMLMGVAASKCVFVTAFENFEAFRSCTEDLAWETEVWIATDPEHMIHRNGMRFMGPYGK